MATEAPALDPRIEEVLRDIASDPRAKLFTCDVEKLVRGLGHARVQASVSSAGLTSAERHLLTIGREEVARLLLIAFRERLEAEQDGSFLYTHERMGAKEWQARAEAARRRGFDGQAERVDLARRAAAGESMTTAELLEACVHNAGRNSVTRADLLAASHRLADRPTTRIYLAIDLCQMNRWHGARSVLWKVASGRPGPLEHYYALEWGGICLNAFGSFEAAIQLLEEAHRTGSSNQVPVTTTRLSLLSALVCALESGSLEHAIRLSHKLAGLEPADSIEQAFFGQLRKRRKSLTHPRLLTQAKENRDVKRALDQFSGTAREILNVWA
jgi:hypothetical protein